MWLDSVWRVSRWFLINSGHCQDCIDGVAIDKNHFLSSYSTTAFPSDALHNANINRFDSVWKVSGGRLDDSGYCLDGYHAKSIVETPMKEHWLLFWLAGSFYLDDPGLAIECSIMGCLKGAWQMSGRCLSCLSDSGYHLGWGGVGVWREIDWHKSNKSNFGQLVPSLPGTSDRLKVVWKVC